MLGTEIGELVADPFAGSGTTGRAARRLDRQSLLVDVSPGYVRQIEELERVRPT